MSEEFQVTDVWEVLESFFVLPEEFVEEGEDLEPPEVVLFDMSDDDFAAILRYLFEHSRDCTVNFQLIGTHTFLLMPSVDVAIEALLSGEVAGAISISLDLLPPLIFFFESPGLIMLSYTRGGWSAMQALALLDLLYELRSHAESLVVQPDPAMFTEEALAAFDRIWHLEYLHDA